MAPDPPRLALFLDLENLLHAPLAVGAVDRARADLREVMVRMRARGTVVTAVASVHHHLWPLVGFEAGTLGIRVHKHLGGPDAADLDLLDRIRAGLPSSVDTVVIGSGDHAFAPVARDLRARGLRVEVIARTGHLARDLYLATQRYHILGAIPA